MTYRFYSPTKCDSDLVFTNSEGAAALGLTKEHFWTPPDDRIIVKVFAEQVSGLTIWPHPNHLEIKGTDGHPAVVMPHYCALCRDVNDGEGECCHKQALREVAG